MTELKEKLDIELHREGKLLGPAMTDRPCDHCGLSTSAIHHAGHLFCCHGCLAAYALIHELGFSEYYAYRDATGDRAGTGVNLSSTSPYARSAAIELLDDLETAGVPVKKTADGLCDVRLGVEGMHCAACSWLIERMQSTMEGVQAAQVRLSDRSVRLIYDPQITNPGKVARALSRLGYLLIPLDDIAVNRAYRQQQRSHWIGIATAAFLAVNAMWIGIALYAGEATGMQTTHAQFLRWTGTTLGVLAAIFPGRIFFRSAVLAVKSRTAHVDLPIALALGMGTLGSVWGAATGQGNIYFDSLASLVLLLRVGRYVQFCSQYKTGLSLSKLFHWNQALAHRIESDGSIKTIAASKLAVDDIVVIQPGEPLPADGEIIDGRTHLNVAWLTGESRPKSAAVGDRAIGGTLNIDAPIRMRVTECGMQSRMGQLEEVIRRAAGERTRLISSADKLGQIFVIVVIALAVGCWITWYALNGIEQATLHTIALLTIACPCAIALAAPLVITVTIGRAARRQIWIRDGESLERLAQPGTMWFDKTGTLTTGETRVVAWVGSREALISASAIEAQINHPLAKAMVEYAVANDHYDESVSVKSLHLWEGLGVTAAIDDSTVMIGSHRFMRQNGISIDDEWAAREASLVDGGRTPVWVAIDGRIGGIAAIGDKLRSDAIPTLQKLRSLGWTIGILSGDRQEVVDDLAEYFEAAGVPISSKIGDCDPEEKVSELRRATQRKKSGPVVFVGDGMNDVAALAVADVGIAIRGGTEMGLRAAPIYLASNRLDSIISLLQASQRSLRSIRRCFAASLIYNAITISLALVGLIHPLIAAIFMPLSGLTVLFFATVIDTFPEIPSQNRR